MEETDVFKALRESYQSYRRSSGRSHVTTLSSIRRYLYYVEDILDLYLRIQRDRRY